MYENLPEGYSKNDRPCGECRFFIAALPAPKRSLFERLSRQLRPEYASRCRRFGISVDKTHHALHQTHAPCFEDCSMTGGNYHPF